MQVRFRKQEADLRQIIAWYQEVAPASLARILDDIHRKIEFLTRFPRSGAKIAGTRLHRAITRRYHFKIAYEPTEDGLTIVGIFRHQDRES